MGDFSMNTVRFPLSRGGEGTERGEMMAGIRGGHGRTEWIAGTWNG